LDCERLRREEIAEDYLAGRLAEPACEEFEHHFFECAACAEALERVRALQLELAEEPALAVAPRPGLRPARRPAWALAAAAAVLVGAVGVAAWFGMPRGADDGVPAPKVPALPDVPVPGTPPAPGWAALASIAPAASTEPALRGATDPGERGFREAMRLYQRGEYAAAIPRLRAVAAAEPARADRAFFLGVSLLLVGQDPEGVEQLRKVVALGDTPFLEEARIYLARGLLRAGEVAAARAELEAVVAMQGDREPEARGLLKQIRELR
jgi:tetratricopeptide (TPR) repeat protein